jgi:hypothetical protein
MRGGTFIKGIQSFSFLQTFKGQNFESIQCSEENLFDVVFNKVIFIELSIPTF